MLQAGLEFASHDRAADVAVAPEVLVLVEHDATLSGPRTLLVLVIAAIPIAVVAVAVAPLPVFAGLVIAAILS
jgi:hypothetical protein